MSFCNKCGTEIPENVNFCQKCGNALQSKQNPNQNSNTVEKTGIVPGYVISIIGLIGTILMFVAISHDYRYTYSPPFTDHEITNIAILVISIILLAIGIGVVGFHFRKK